MSYSHALVETERPARYAKQMAAHFSHKMETSWDGETGTIIFVGAGKESEDPRRAFDGTCVVTMRAEEGRLAMQLEAPEELLDRFEGVIDRHLLRFGASEGLAYTWARSAGE
ncbi:DUF2218 domain-containing protein [Corynebacterium sp. 13CS0277]|uniref:DUF2218 domain-containing protein n=1 Tax=Corynebacterium sp. 13CS0277 TaxID=2071994 RepID=UPI000D045456|nr:DUF2218 domain-containing protein [Corynebacterium sp. 13CS0277]PRQ12265.1 DUF2218 domain-containing protein [Corynebacterium sp. 13CS0277]